MNLPKVALVTGGAGFIGSHLVDLLLANNFQVRVVDNLSNGSLKNLEHHQSNKNLYFENLDIRDLEPHLSILHEVNYVFHLAGIGDIVPSIENPLEYFSVNYLGTLKLLEALRLTKITKLVYAASSSCYGLAEQVPTSEDSNISPQYPYALSKYQAEQLCFHWEKVYKLPVNSICIFNAYGPRAKTQGAYGAVMGVFLKQKLEAKPFTIVGDGNQRRDFIHVKDVARAFYQTAMSDEVGQRFNIGTGNPKSINYLAELLQGPKIYLPKRPGEPDVTWADTSKIKKRIGWNSQITFEEGIKEILSKIDDWKEAPLWDEHSIQTATKTWFKYLETNP